MDLKEFAMGSFLRAEDLEKWDEKTAVIVGPPRVKSVEENGLHNPTLEMEVELPDHKKKIYTANKTSARKLGEVWGWVESDWVGKRLKFTVADQNVKGEMKKVLYSEPSENQPA